MIADHEAATDADLVRAAADGDEIAFAAIVQRHRGSVSRHVAHRLMVMDPMEHEHVMQDTWIKCYLSLDKLSHPDTRLLAWLCRVAGNQCLDLLRRRARAYMDPFDPIAHDVLLAQSSDQPDTIAASRVTQDQVRAVLVRLSARHRRALILRDSGLDCYEIGDAFGLSRSAVKSMLWRARDEFRRTWTLLHGAEESAA